MRAESSAPRTRRHTRRRSLVQAALLVALAWGGSTDALADEGDPVPDIPGAPSVVADVPCVNGFAGVFPCRNVDLLSWMPLELFPGGFANDIWGWTDSATRREYALLGLTQGVAFVDVSDPTHPVLVGILPAESTGSNWSVIKV